MIIDHPNESHIPLLRQLWQEAFGDAETFLDDFFRTAYHPSRCLALWHGHRLATALYWFDCSCRGKKAAYVYAVATGKAHRGQGFCHALMTRLHELLARQGCAMCVLVPGSETLFRLYASLGYTPFGGLEELFFLPGNAEVPLRQISAEEYAFLRRALLPQGGIVQEGENLAFLQTQCGLYTGSGFLLAAHVEDGCLFAPELLGSTDTAPGILRALGCRQGRFRVPGGRPFAMYRALLPCEPPEYFSIAFD